MMNNLSAHVLIYVGAAILLGSFSLVGAALLGYGLQAELAKLMSGGAAAILVGAALVGAPAVLVALQSGKSRSTPEGGDAKPQVVAKAALSSGLSALARTAFIGLATRRPIATIGLAALAGALISARADAESAPDRDRKPAKSPA